MKHEGSTMQHDWLITLRQVIHVSNGHFERKQTNKKSKKKSEEPTRVFVFFIEVTSNLCVEVSMPLGNTKEAIPFKKKKKKKDSLNHIPTHFVIRLDSKSILKPGPLDSSKNPRSSFLNIPAHMNHCSSWLLEGISCPALLLTSLSRSSWLLCCWKVGQEPDWALIWTQKGGRRRRRAGAKDKKKESPLRDNDLGRVLGGDAFTPESRVLVLYPSICSISSEKIKNKNTLLRRSRGCGLLSFWVLSTFSLGQMFVISVSTPLHTEHHAKHSVLLWINYTWVRTAIQLWRKKHVQK